VGEVEAEESVLVIKRIQVTYHLKLRHEDRDTAERVHGFHKDRCPVARSIGGCIAITTTLELDDTAPA
jgi:organic hydroperoxide reductase OsmC/OhrA